MSPLSELLLRASEMSTDEVQLNGICPVRPADNALRLMSCGIRAQLAGIVLPITLLEMEMTCTLIIGLLTDPHSGRGPTILEEKP